MDEQIKPVAWIVGNASFGPYDFRKTEPRGWGYSEPLIKLSEHRAAIDALRAEVDALRTLVEDATRDRLNAEDRAERAESEAEALRWVVEQYVTLQTDGGGRWRVEFGYTSPVSYGPWAGSRMAAIDAARKGAE